MRAQDVRWCCRLALWGVMAVALPAGAQPTAAQAAAAAGGGSSTSANGGTGGVGLGGAGPGVAARPGTAGGAGSPDTVQAPGNGALVGPRAQRQSRELMAEHPDRVDGAPGNTGQRALMLDQSRRPATAASAVKNRP
ncbi:MAG: hypothetical protein QM777_15570 [Pseudorhodoferax sp.]